MAWDEETQHTLFAPCAGHRRFCLSPVAWREGMAIALQLHVTPQWTALLFLLATWGSCGGYM